ncbi:MAG TPA: carboxymuconolactone decarboxylase family protein, partial [Paraburkholderia sp.]
MAQRQSGGGRGPDRLPPMAAQDLSPEQTAAAAAFEAARGVPVFGPFWPLIRSPQLMLRAHEMGQYLRYNGSLPHALSEMAILLVSSHWKNPVEWEIHCPAALKAGLPQTVVEAIAKGERPAAMSPQETVVFEAFQQLHRDRAIDDTLYAK